MRGRTGDYVGGGGRHALICNSAVILFATSPELFKLTQLCGTSLGQTPQYISSKMNSSRKFAVLLVAMTLLVIQNQPSVRFGSLWIVFTVFSQVADPQSGFGDAILGGLLSEDGILGGVPGGDGLMGGLLGEGGL
ncbi:hypothetical protein J6590_024463 [Homalodisca vitripennis]|nr:hypothetical protein J6590_024463 [Homalodisca vitripennis]